ncbi:MAG: hypothetical protein LBE59_02400 [Nevskiaceae bacterium]|nr:hypothetical protein [Nevskiaceae bacterium]
MAGAQQSVEMWDFGQHSVHERCSQCGGEGAVACSSCGGKGNQSCSRCGGVGVITRYRWVATGPNDQGHNEVYRQNCYACGSKRWVACSPCSGSGKVECSGCSGHGFFTHITSVTVRAEPKVIVTTHSALSNQALTDYLLTLPVGSVVQYLDFTPFNHQDTAPDTWRVGYESHTTAAELVLVLRGKTYLAAAVGDKALAFIRPPVFDDVFIEELTDLNNIWSGGEKSFNTGRARKFFETYSGQPVLDAALKSVAQLKAADRQSPGQEVIRACEGYISTESGNLLERCMIALLDKISPPNSLWSWIGVMALPLLLLFLGAQNLVERETPEGWFPVTMASIVLALAAAVVTCLVSPVAAFISMIVSAIRRRSVPAEYRQHGRNWQPFKRFAGIAVLAAWLGGAIGLLTHHQKLPRWNNAPMAAIEKTLHLERFAPYVKTAAWFKRKGIFVGDE